MTILNIVVPLKSLSNFWRTLETPPVNYEVNLDLNQSENCVICKEDKTTTFAITNAKFLQ